ncbi:MAG: SAF domain-containing protein [bacterium]|nr:SAF domain-containing protein [bacterium]
MNPKPPFLKDLFELIKQVWAPFAGFVSAIIFIGNFIELWKGNEATYTILIAILGLFVLLLALIWIGFSQVDSKDKLILPNKKGIFHPRYPFLYKMARFSLSTMILISLVGGYLLWEKSKNTENEVVILISKFDGPNPQDYRVTEIIWEHLSASLQNYNDVTLTLFQNGIITSYEQAEIEGKNYNATIVIWGWYGITDENARIVIHYDILREFVNVPHGFRSKIITNDSDVTEFKKFFTQDELAKEITFLSLTTVGLVRYSFQDWDGAIFSFKESQKFTSITNNIELTQSFIDQSINAKNLENIKQGTSENPSIPVEVFYASMDIPQGTKISESFLSTLSIPAENVTSTMYTSQESQDIIGKISKFPLDQGVVITETMVTDYLDLFYLLPITPEPPELQIWIGGEKVKILKLGNFPDIVGTVRINYLDCYENPTRLSSVIYSFLNGDQIDLIARDDSSYWVLVDETISGKECWVISHYLNLDIK